MLHIDALERTWIIAVSAVLGIFMAALFASVFVFGIRLPSPVGRVDPRQLEQTDFSKLGLTNTAPGQYMLRMKAKMWQFDAGQALGQRAELHVPKGSRVTFELTSADVTHGVIVEEHDINLMVLPGQIARTSAAFNRPGTYHIICHEYCGGGHQGMYATIVVDE